MYNPEDAQKLLDNGWAILLTRGGLGNYNALAVKQGSSVDTALDEWEGPNEYDEDEPEEEMIDRLVFGGCNRYSGSGVTISEALQTVTEKVLFRRLPRKE